MVNCGISVINDLRKKIAYNYELVSTAYHEAGHTIYGLLHLMKVNSVFIYENKQDKRIEGLTIYDNYFNSGITDPQLVANLIKDEICIFYAGLSAEKHHFKVAFNSDKFPIFLRDGSSDDTLLASKLIEKFNLAPSGKKRHAFKQKLRKKTSDELQLHWDAISLVAQALLQKKKLHYSNLKELLLKKSSNKKFWKERFKQIDNMFNNNISLDEKRLKSILLP